MSQSRLLQDSTHLENRNFQGCLGAGLVLDTLLGCSLAGRLGLAGGLVASGLEPTALLDTSPVLEDRDGALLVVVLEGRSVGTVGDLAVVVGLTIKEVLLVQLVCVLSDSLAGTAGRVVESLVVEVELDCGGVCALLGAVLDLVDKVCEAPFRDLCALLHTCWCRGGSGRQLGRDGKG